MDKKSKDNKKLYMVGGAVLVAVVVVASFVSQSTLFQGYLNPRNALMSCDPGTVTSNVTSWVPTSLTSYTPPKNGSTPVVSKVPCKKSNTRPPVGTIKLPPKK
jgi:hypothetical protein